MAEEDGRDVVVLQLEAVHNGSHVVDVRGVDDAACLSGLAQQVQNQHHVVFVVVEN